MVSIQISKAASNRTHSKEGPSFKSPRFSVAEMAVSHLLNPTCYEIRIRNDHQSIVCLTHPGPSIRCYQDLLKHLPLEAQTSGTGPKDCRRTASSWRVSAEQPRTGELREAAKEQGFLRALLTAQGICFLTHRCSETEELISETKAQTGNLGSPMRTPQKKNILCLLHFPFLAGYKLRTRR